MLFIHPNLHFRVGASLPHARQRAFGNRSNEFVLTIQYPTIFSLGVLNCHLPLVLVIQDSSTVEKCRWALVSRELLLLDRLQANTVEDHLTSQYSNFEISELGIHVICIDRINKFDFAKMADETLCSASVTKNLSPLHNQNDWLECICKLAQEFYKYCCRYTLLERFVQIGFSKYFIQYYEQIAGLVLFGSCSN